MAFESFVARYPFLFLLGVWILISFLASRLSGWHRLAKEYPVHNPFEGKPRRFQTLWMRYGSHYGNITTVGANAQGLYLSVLFLFRIGHDPLFIPWSEITAAETTGGLFKRIRLQFKRLPAVPVIIDRRLAEILVKESYGVLSIR